MATIAFFHHGDINCDDNVDHHATLDDNEGECGDDDYDIYDDCIFAFTMMLITVNIIVNELMMMTTMIVLRSEGCSLHAVA